ncbi:hypothetical protein UY3_16159 [Chelonia mydas]|uniref:Uncharacterized protein n=1 Tax=Chelonia mydas TaxID=8469 RepID=M7AQ80_CHEMY|nr:hypothetical protein UY3_16159 [Chelonia mydas]
MSPKSSMDTSEESESQASAGNTEKEVVDKEEEENGRQLLEAAACPRSGSYAEAWPGSMRDALSAGVAPAAPIGHGSWPMGATELVAGSGAACRAPQLPLHVGAGAGTCRCFWERHGAMASR